MKDYSNLAGKSLFMNTGSFDSFGGWVLDTQFILSMGSEYLLAHGLGVPVEDAKTTVIFPSVGSYRVWVYTFDWVSPWKKDDSPGIFELLINGRSNHTVFGCIGDKWHWQDGGIVTISDLQTPISLHDITGFEGRCAGLFFTQDTRFMPPDELSELAEFRRVISRNVDIEDGGEFDIIVVGGGIAGICSALSSAREGLKTALIHDRSLVGGNNSSEVRVWLGGKTNFEPFPKIGNIVSELEQKEMAHYGCSNQAHLYEDSKKLAILNKEENITLYLDHYLIDSETEDNSIKRVSVYDVKAGKYKTIRADLFVDASGDAALGYLSGADYEMTTNGHMGMTNFWYIEKTNTKQSFQRCPWAIDLSKTDFPGRSGFVDSYNRVGELSLGCWFWESGSEHDPIDMAEYARDTNFRAMYGAWDCLKNIDIDFVDYKLAYSSYIAGRRESRRLLGDIVLTKSEVKKSFKFDDACVPSTWTLDVHYPDRNYYSAFYEGDAFIANAYHEYFPTPYFIPYRCLYSRNIKNLFMAGRDISVSHDALGTIRVMRTCGMMGEVLGKAAILCKNYNCNPRDIYSKYLTEFLDSLK